MHLLTVLSLIIPLFGLETVPDLPVPPTDTLVLKAGSVVAERDYGTGANGRYNIGNRRLTFGSGELESGKSLSLSDFLQQRTALYIKEYGNGAGAYLSLRGTSSSHTSIDWNGQDLSLPTLGQTDLSHIPLYFFDGLSVRLGGNSALYGNGSVGGSLQLTTGPRWEEGLSGNILLQAGSFLSRFAGATLRYSRNGWETKTALFHTGSRNDFIFRNNTRKGFPKERANNASYHNFGILQEVFRRFGSRHLFSAGAYYLDFDREIQPSVSSNSRPETFKSIQDRNLKAYADLRGEDRSSRWKYNAHTAYSLDYEYYEGDIIAAHRFLASAETEYRHSVFSIKAGTAHTYTVPMVHAYADGITEWRNEVFLTARVFPCTGLTLAGGMRYTHVTGVKVPVQPALEARYELPAGPHLFGIRSSVARSTKIPTLNDRYWGGDYTFLQPEVSLNTEAGTDYRYRNCGWEIGASLTLYRADVRDWIRWLPVGEIWRPQNLARVRSRGTETGASLKKELARWHYGFRIDYAYTDVCLTESDREDDTALGVQLAYQPYHTLNAGWEAGTGALTLQLSSRYVGARTTTDRFDRMDPYWLLDAAVRYRFDWAGLNWTTGVEANNILNTNYQNVKFYAMPGFNFKVSLSISL